MPILIVLPAALRELAGGRQEVRLERGSGPLSDVLSQLWTACPAIRDRVMTERNEVRPHVSIFVDGEDSRYSGGLATHVGEGAEIMLLPAISGG
jgi:molybdopterin synthase sulfur carrier subunit